MGLKSVLILDACRFRCSFLCFVFLLQPNGFRSPFHEALIFGNCVLQEKEGEGRGRFKSHSTAPARIADREKKAPLKQ